MPIVSVLLPVRDAGPWLASSLASLARQTLVDHEVIAVDDGSRDGSGEALERAARLDPRLRVVRTPPRGLPAALATAHELARAPLVARQDADDLSHRTRLERQVAFLATHPGVDVVGCAVRLFPRSATGVGMRRWERWHNSLLTHDDMVHELLIDSPIAHGAVMLRREALERVGGWREHGWAEDLDLWIRLAESGARFAKLESCLYGWRQHAANSTRTDERYSRENFVALKVAALDRGLLANGRRGTLVGVGSSLERWRTALGTRLTASVELRHPPVNADARLTRPVIAAFMAPEARVRWRMRLRVQGWIEGRDFIFIA